jgi:hypothetical protein
MQINCTSSGNCTSLNPIDKTSKHKKNYFLEASLFQRATSYLDTHQNIDDLPRAAAGKTPVYLPRELPIVFKQSGDEENFVRLRQMIAAKKICDENDYTSLVIPTARCYKDFIIESRLPITGHDTKSQIGLYVEHKEQFTEAIKEFAGFFFQADLDDIVGKNYDPYGVLSKTALGRYDNVALYLEEGKGKIGLIDLETFRPDTNESKQQWGKEWGFLKCIILVDLFPYHVDAILDMAKKFVPNVEEYRNKLEEEKAEALKRFKIAYENHLDFIKEKGITIDNPIAFTLSNSISQEDLKKTVLNKISLEANEGNFSLFLKNKKEVDQVLNSFDRIFPKILILTTDFLSNLLKIKFDNTKETISSEKELLRFRSLFFTDSSNKWSIKGSKKLYDNFKKQLVQILSEAEINLKLDWAGDALLNVLLQSTLEGLTKAKEISYYNPEFGYGGYAVECVFC